MHCYRIFFSPTGGTEKVAAAITQSWPEVQAVDLSVPSADFSSISVAPDDLVLVAMPTFEGVAPQLALDRFAQIKGNGAKCVLTAVYGNRACESALVQMEDTAVAANFQVIAAVLAIAEHSIIHEYAAGRPDSKDCKTLSEFGKKILDKAASGSCTVPSVPGKRPYKKSTGVIVPAADSHCTNCGLCAEKCPAQAISKENCKLTDKTKCISCMRCVSICPTHARSVNKVLVAAAALAIKKACSVPKPNELFL